MATWSVRSLGDDGSPGTLRWAIIQVNSEGVPSTIEFNIPGDGVQTIALTAALPAVTAPVVIDGSTQPSYAGRPLIQIDGTGAGANSDGLVLTAGASLVKGLAVTGFSGAGIVLQAGAGGLVQSNVIGADPSGTRAMPNGAGIVLRGSSGNTIGGSTAGQGNLISGNRGNGITVARTTADSSANWFLGNFIGTTSDGSASLGNQSSGLVIDGATGNFVGGHGAAGGNLVSGNGRYGIQLVLGASANLITGNLIGTTADGARPLTNLRDGILLDGAPSNTIGGTVQTQANVISGNLGGGVRVAPGSTETVIVGNLVGTDRAGTARLGNAGDGILLASSGNTVGGPGDGAGNTIAFNGTGLVGAGVQLAGLVKRNTILSNSIHDNAGLGINLGNGPTPNHTPDQTDGPNNFQNYPIFTNAKSDGQTTTVSGTLQSAPGSTYTVQIFSSPMPDPSGYGEGQKLLATITVTTDATGTAPITTSIPTDTQASASLSATATDAAGNTSEFSPVVLTRGVTDLAVSLEATPNPVAQGSNLTYTVTVTNTGLVDAHNVVLSDQLPGTVRVVSVAASQGGPIRLAQFISANLGTLPANASATVTIVVQALASPGNSIFNSVSATMDEIDPSLANNSASVTTAVAPVADLGLTLSAGSSSLHVGDSLTYTLIAQNRGPAAATHVTVAMPIAPGAASFLSATSTQGTTTFSDGRFSASLGNLAPGGRATITVVVRASAAGTLTEAATISGDQVEPNPVDNTATVSVTVDPAVDLAVAIAPSASPVTTGQALVLAVQARNQGPGPASGVELRADVPDGMIVVSASSDRGDSPSSSGGTVTANVGSLAVGESVNLWINVVVVGVPGDSLTPTVVGTTTEFDVDYGSNSASATIPVRAASQLSLAMTPSVSSLPVGQSLVYTLLVTNHGPADEPHAVVRVPLGGSLTLLSASSSQGAQPRADHGIVTADLGPLPVGALATVVLSTSPLPGALGQLSVSGLAQGDNVNLEPSLAAATATVTVTPSSNLGVIVAAQSPHAYLGTDLAYTITVRNEGPSDASDVHVTAPLPDGVAFVSASTTQGAEPEVHGGQLTASLGLIRSGRTATISVVTRPSETTPRGTALTLSASAQGGEFDPDPNNNSTSTSMDVLPSDDLAVTLGADSEETEVGRLFTLRMSVYNAGPSLATGVRLHLPLAPGAEYVSAAGAIPVALQSGVLVAQVGSLALGDRADVSVTFRSTATGQTAWTAGVSGDQFDLDGTNNQAALTMTAAESAGVFQFSSASVSVAETAGVAAITVVRLQGARGPASVRYHTEAGNAIPGVDYHDVSGVLTFGAGETVKTIHVPVLPNPHDNHDEFVRVSLDAVTGGAALGSIASTVLRIQNMDPDFTPPRVTGLQLLGSASAITRIVITFSEPLDPATALDSLAYRLGDLGSSGIVTSSAGARIDLSTPVYDPSTWSVTLVPSRPLRSGRFYKVQVNGDGAGLVRDLAGNALAGSSTAAPGTGYVAMFERGARIKYRDNDGDLVSLQVKKGGYLDAIRGPDGEAQVIRLVGGVRRKSVLSGSVSRSRGRGNRRASLGTLEGLGHFGDVRVTLASPPFFVRQYPFFLGKGRVLHVMSVPSRTPKHPNR